MSKKVWYKIAEFMELTGYSKRRVREYISDGNIRRGNWKRGGPRRAYLIRVPEAMEDIRNTVAGRNPEKRNPALSNPAPTLAEVKNPGASVEAMAAALAVPVATTSTSAPQDPVAAMGFSAYTLTEAQAETARQKAAEIKMKNDERAGSLVDAAQVAEDAFNCARLTRDAVLGVPDRIAAELASITDPHTLNDKLTQELTLALEELGERL